MNIEKKCLWCGRVCKYRNRGKCRNFKPYSEIVEFAPNVYKCYNVKTISGTAFKPAQRIISNKCYVSCPPSEIEN